MLDPDRMLRQFPPELRYEWVRQFLQWMRQVVGGDCVDGFLRFGRSFIYYKYLNPLLRISSTLCASSSLFLSSLSLSFLSFSSSMTFSKLSRFLSSTIGIKFSRTCCENCLILSALILLQSSFISFSSMATFIYVGLLYDTLQSSPALLILLSLSRIDYFYFSSYMNVFQWSEISAKEIGLCRLRMSASFFFRYQRIEACFWENDYYSLQCSDL